MTYPEDDRVEQDTTEEVVENEETETTEETGKTEESLKTDTLETEEKKGSDAVPYNRFQEVNNKYREAEKALAVREAELNLIKQQIAAQYPAQKKRRYANEKAQAFHEEYIEPAIDEATGELRKEIAALKKEREADKIARQEEAKAKDTSAWLTGELKKLKGSYKHMDIEDVENAWITNPKADLTVLAKKSHAKAQKIIDDYIGGKQRDSEHIAGSPTGTIPSTSVQKVPKEYKSWSLEKQLEFKANEWAKANPKV